MRRGSTRSARREGRRKARMNDSEKRNHSHPAKKDEFISLNIADVFNCRGDYFGWECDWCCCYFSMRTLLLAVRFGGDKGFCAVLDYVQTAMGNEPTIDWFQILWSYFISLLLKINGLLQFGINLWTIRIRCKPTLMINFLQLCKCEHKNSNTKYTQQIQQPS